MSTSEKRKFHQCNDAETLEEDEKVPKLQRLGLGASSCSSSYESQVLMQDLLLPCVGGLMDLSEEICSYLPWVDDDRFACLCRVFRLRFFDVHNHEGAHQAALIVESYLRPFRATPVVAALMLKGWSANHVHDVVSQLKDMQSCAQRNVQLQALKVFNPPPIVPLKTVVEICSRAPNLEIVRLRFALNSIDMLAMKNMHGLCSASVRWRVQFYLEGDGSRSILPEDDTKDMISILSMRMCELILPYCEDASRYIPLGKLLLAADPQRLASFSGHLPKDCVPFLPSTLQKLCLVELHREVEYPVQSLVALEVSHYRSLYLDQKKTDRSAELACLLQTNASTLQSLTLNSLPVWAWAWHVSLPTPLLPKLISLHCKGFVPSDVLHAWVSLCAASLKNLVLKWPSYIQRHEHEAKNSCFSDKLSLVFDACRVLEHFTIERVPFFSTSWCVHNTRDFIRSIPRTLKKLTISTSTARSKKKSAATFDVWRSDTMAFAKTMYPDLELTIIKSDI